MENTIYLLIYTFEISTFTRFIYKLISLLNIK